MQQLIEYDINYDDVIMTMIAVIIVLKSCRTINMFFLVRLRSVQISNRLLEEHHLTHEQVDEFRWGHQAA